MQPQSRHGLWFDSAAERITADLQAATTLHKCSADSQGASPEDMLNCADGH